jgi:pimeloyl-ACP methyl ester carboxylesterase
VLAESGYHVIAYDARGHGDSDWDPEGRYDSDTLVADLAAVLVQCAHQPAVLVGASLGGTTSLIATGEGRVNARAVVLVDIVPRVEAEGVDRIRAFMLGSPEGFGSLEEVADAVARFRPGRPRPTDISGLARNVRRASNGRLYWHWDPRLQSGQRQEALERMHRLNACASQLSIPALLVHGLQSDVVSEEGAREFISLCPHGRYVGIGSAGHMVAGDANDAFAAAIAAFLSEVT